MADLNPGRRHFGLDAEILEEMVHLLGEPAHEGERAAVRLGWRGLRAARDVLDLSLSIGRLRLGCVFELCHGFLLRH